MDAKAQGLRILPSEKLESNLKFADAVAKVVEYEKAIIEVRGACSRRYLVRKNLAINVRCPAFMTVSNDRCEEAPYVALVHVYRRWACDGVWRVRDVMMIGTGSYRTQEELAVLATAISVQQDCPFTLAQMRTVQNILCAVQDYVVGKLSELPPDDWRWNKAPKCNRGKKGRE